ncbi:MAG: hypothetical protein ISF22_06675 [Methanomassiliicoccus sp.]|nr:hypothetical protein [Methanomassiliicoccus sp.]
MAGGKKSFQGSILLLVILLLICFPAGLIYLVIKWEEDTTSVPMRTCMSCGANIPVNYNVCPHCGKATMPEQVPPQA